MREIVESPEETIDEVPEEHVGDLITLEDVSVRIDGEVSFEAGPVSDRLDHEVYKFATPEGALSSLTPVLEAFERAVSNPFPGHSYVTVPMSRYSVFDVDIEPLESNPTAAILRGAQDRISEALQEGMERDGQGSWRLIQGTDADPLSAWVMSCFNDLEPLTFTSNTFQICSFDDRYRRLKIVESGKFDDHWDYQYYFNR